MIVDKREINELIRLMNTVDGRDFFYNFFLKSCGVDFSLGVPSGVRNDYDIGVKKPAIDFLNLLIYHCPEKFEIMLNEQKNRENLNG